MSDFNFVGAAYQAASITQDDQSCINWYPETDPTKKPASEKGPAERGIMALYPTPGTVTRAELDVAEVRGVHTLPGGNEMIAVSGSEAYLIQPDYSKAVIGSLLTFNGPVSITDNGTSAYFTDGQHRYAYDLLSGYFSAVTDGPFIEGGVCDILDNFIIYNRPGTRQWGCTDVSSSASGALNLGSLIGASCNIKAVVADHRQVLVIGENFSERHVNVGTFPFPFAVIPGSSMQHGCDAPASIARLGESVIFLALDNRGRSSVIMWGAATTTPVRVSTFAVESAFQSYSVTSDAIGYSYAQSGHEFYVLTFPTENVTWCFDLASNLWHKRAWRNDMGILNRHRSNCCTVFGNDIVVGDFENGKLYALSQQDYTDDGDAIPCIRRCRHITSDLNRQFFSSLQIQFQPGVGLVTGQGDDPECILRWSNDGGFTWGNDHPLKLGKIGRYKHRAIKRRLGYSRDRIFEIEMTDPVYRVVVSAELNASAGAN